MNQLSPKMKNQVGRLKWWQVALISVIVSFIGKLQVGWMPQDRKKTLKT